MASRFLKVANGELANGECGTKPYFYPCVQEFFTLAHDGRTRGHPFKLAVLRSTCEARRFSFSRRVVPLWNSLPAEVVDADSVLSFKQRYDRFIAVRAMREDANIFVTS